MYTYNYYKKSLLFFFIIYQNEREEHKFWQQKYQKVTFTIKTKKKMFNIGNIDVSKILISKKEQCGKYNLFKYIIGYNDNGVIRPLYLFISQTTGYG